MADGRRTVVVTTNLSIQRRSDGKMFAAHLDGLGLTAYGYTAEDARESVVQSFKQWVGLHRDEGILERRLNQLGVLWQWLDSYEGDLPVEHVTDLASAAFAEDAPRYHAFHGDFALAA